MKSMNSVTGGTVTLWLFCAAFGQLVRVYNHRRIQAQPNVHVPLLAYDRTVVDKWSNLSTTVPLLIYLSSIDTSAPVSILFLQNS
jgi:hypothetical protein